MTIPNSQAQPGETYTFEEVQHLVAQQVARLQIDALTNRMDKHESIVAGELGKINASLTGIQHTMGRGSETLRDTVNSCKLDVEAELRRDYASKLDLEKLEGKFNVFAAKIIAGVSVAVFVIQLVFFIFGRHIL